MTEKEKNVGVQYIKMAANIQANYFRYWTMLCAEGVCDSGDTSETLIPSKITAQNLPTVMQFVYFKAQNNLIVDIAKLTNPEKNKNDGQAIDINNVEKEIKKMVAQASWNEFTDQLRGEENPKKKDWWEIDTDK